MNLDSLNKWLMLAANLGVIAGIFFLAIEIDQNQENIELQNTLNLVESRAASTDFFNDTRLFLLDHPDVLVALEKANTGQPLTEEETANYNLFCAYDIWGRFNVFVRMDALSLNFEADAIISGLLTIIRTERHKDCWDRVKTAILDRGYEDFVNKIDAQIEKN